MENSLGKATQLNITRQSERYAQLLAACGSPEVIARVIQARRRELVEAATARMVEASPATLEAMISRSQGDGRDAQRAGERILEQVGVLDKPGSLPEGVESIDILALRIRRSTQQPQQQERGTIDGSVA